MKLFGYDRKSQDKYVDAQKLARDTAYSDSRKIESAAGILRGQIGGIQAAAGGMFAAGAEAAGIGRANAANILAETGEWARRRQGAQQAERSQNRARAAASGIQLDTGGSSDQFQAAVKGEHSKEIAWAWKAGKSQSNIATREGLRAQMEANSAGEGILAGIPGVLSQAALYETDASALRSSADLAVAEARANRASARSGAYATGISTIISAIATYGAATGFGAAAGAGTMAAPSIGGAAATSGTGIFSAGVLGTGFSGAQLALAGTAFAGGIAALKSFGGSGNTTAAQIAGQPQQYNTTVAGVTGSKNFDSSKVPKSKTFAAPAPPDGKATATTKRQYAAQTAKKGKAEGNIFGGSTNPLAAVGAF